MGWFHNLRPQTSGSFSSFKSVSTHDLRNRLLEDRALQSQSNVMASTMSRSNSSEEQRYVIRRIKDNPMWTLDRGTGFYQQERLNKRKASLLGSGRDAGKSKVLYYGIEWTRILQHVWKRDFFTTAVHSRFPVLVLAMMLVFISSFLFWACIYYVIWKADPTCFLGFTSFLSAFLFSIETQNTIGYGSHAIGDCWIPAWLVGIQCILAVLLEAVFIGIIFAKISHPKGRSRTILISECACIARRDGILKFMFRVADIRKRTAIAPKVHAVMYTWGPGHTTAEGEHIPVLVQQLTLHYLDATLLLPIIVEHTIDERSPLYGHTSGSLEALGAEIVVTFEGTSELGDTFMTRMSYLPSEIHWGCMFVNVIQQAEPGMMQHTIDLSRFHDVEPLSGLSMIPPHRISKAVVLGGSRRVPWARLGENTLLLADELVVTQAADGRWFLVVRIGDAYPSQMCAANIQMFFYRYSDTERPPPSATATAAGDPSSVSASYQQQTYVHQELPLTRHLWGSETILQQHQQEMQPGSQQQQAADAAVSTAAPAATGTTAGAIAAAVAGRGGGVNVLLRYPVVVGHEIGPNSPLKEWITAEGMLKDADAEIVVVASATQYVTSHLAMRSKVYSVLGSIRWGHGYAPCVVPPKRSATGHAQVDWSRFHDVIPIHPAARRRTTRHHPSGLGQQQQQQQSSWDRQQHSMSEQWTGSSVHAAADAYSSQISEVLENMTGGSLSASRQQQQDGWQQPQQQQQRPHQEVPVGLLRQQMREAEAAVEGLEVGWERSSVTGAAASDAVSISRHSSMLGALPISRQTSQQRHPQQRQTEQNNSFAAGAPDQLFIAHSLGFTERHNAGQQQFHHHQQMRQGITSAAQLHDTTAASDAADLLDEEHTFAVLPKRAASWKDKRSLAAVLDLFEAAAPFEEQAAEGNASSSAQAAASAAAGSIHSASGK